MGRRTGHPVYEVDGYLVADVSTTITGDESGVIPGVPSSAASGELSAAAYGCIADGVAHNNLANLMDAMSAASAAGKLLRLPPGVLFLDAPILGTLSADSGRTFSNNGGIPIPVGQACRVEGYGRGVSTLKLSATVPRAFDFRWVVDGQNYKNVTFDKFTIDANSVTGLSTAPAVAVTAGASLAGSGVWTTVVVPDPTVFAKARLVYFPSANIGTAQGVSMAARISGGNLQVRNDKTTATLTTGDVVQGACRDAVIGNWYSGGSVAYTNMTFDRVKFGSELEIINLPTQFSATLTTPRSDARFGIHMLLHPSGTNPPASPLTATNIDVDCQIWGGENGAYISGDAGTFIDQCGAGETFKHSTLTTPTTNSTSANFLVGGIGGGSGGAWVGRCWFRGWGELSADVGVELDQPWEAEISGLIDDAYSGAFYSTTTVAPARTSAGPPTAAVSGAVASGDASLVVNAFPAGVDMEGWIKVDSELLWYQRGTTTTLAIFRAMNGTSAAAHSDGAAVTFIEQAKTRIVHKDAKAIRRRLTIPSDNLGRGIFQYTTAALPLPRLVGRFEWEREGADHIVTGEALFANGLYDIDGLDITARASGINYTSGTTQRASLVAPTTSTSFGPGQTTLTGPKPSRCRGKFQLDASGEFGAGGIWYGFNPQQTYVDLDVEVRGGSIFKGATGTQTQLAAFRSQSSSLIQGRIRVVNRVPGGDAAPVALSIPSTSTVTIRHLLVALDASLQSFSAGTGNSNYLPWQIDSTNAENVIIESAEHSQQVVGGYARRPLKRRVVTAATTLNAWDEYVALQMAGAAAVTLPLSTSTASGVGINPGAGGVVVIKDETGNLAANNVTLTATGTDTIDGAATLVMNTNRQTVRLMPTGAGYAVV